MTTLSVKNPYSRQRGASLSSTRSTKRSALPSQQEDAAAYPQQEQQRQHQQILSRRILSSTNIFPVSALQLLQQERAQRQADPLSLLLLKPPYHDPGENSNSTNISDHNGYEWLQLHHGVHQISGPAGSGKTQLALSCCRQAAAAYRTTTRPASSRSNQQQQHQQQPAAEPIRAIYISLSGHRAVSHVAQRLQQMCGDDQTGDNPKHNSCLQRIWTRGCTTPEDLLELLRETIPRLLTQQQQQQQQATSSLSSSSTVPSPVVRLIVLDSVADLFRLESNIPGRSALLFQVAAALQDLVFCCCASLRSARPLSILVLNQVTADFSTTSTTTSLNLNDAKDAWIPALGLSWAHCVHSHFQVERWEQQHGSTSAGGTTPKGLFQRRLWLVHSPRHAPHHHNTTNNNVTKDTTTASFAVTQAGCEMRH